MNPEYPVYIISKGRWDTRHTVKALERMGVPYSIVVEEQEHDLYASVIDPENILVLPTKYKREYDLCTDDEPEKGTGSGPARNFCWDHSIERGAERHWLIDDNIYDFYRLYRNKKHRMGDGTCFKVIEDFVDRYENVALAGFQYEFFVPKRSKVPPIHLNTRIYSCLLIMNDIPYRWRARYNEDVDLSLRVLKEGWCTVEFNAFLQDKIATQTVKGGNTDELYREGTLKKSQMIADLHPDVVRVTHRYGRIHHYVDYRPFRKNKLRLREGVEIPEGSNNYGLSLERVEHA